MTPVFAVEVTQSGKVGPVSATYAAQGSCPKDCAFYRRGCYAENGHMAMIVTKRLNRSGATPLEIALREAELIDGLSGARDLRLHIVGDCATIEATLIVAASAERYMDRGGRRAWTYILSKQNATQRALEAEAVIRQKEAEAKQAAATAQGRADALRIEAEGQAAANRLISESLTPALIQFQAVQKLADNVTVALIPSGEGVIIDPATLLAPAP